MQKCICTCTLSKSTHPSINFLPEEMEGQDQSDTMTPCILCGFPFPREELELSPERSIALTLFLQQLERFSASVNFWHVSSACVCDACVTDLTLATGNGEAVETMEAHVRSLQQQLLHIMRQLQKLLAVYLEGMKGLERKVRRSQIAGEDWTSTVNLRSAIIEVVQVLSSCQESTLSEKLLLTPTSQQSKDMTDSSILMEEPVNPLDQSPESESMTEMEVESPSSEETHQDNVTSEDEGDSSSGMEANGSSEDEDKKVVMITVKFAESKDKEKAPHPANLVPCPECDKKISSKGLHKHLRRVHGPAKLRTPANCDLCHAKMAKSELAKHLLDHVGEEYVIHCPNKETCAFACVTQGGIKNHIKTNPQCRKKAGIDEKTIHRDQVTCQQCVTVCKSLLELRGHVIRLHETKEKNFPCPISGCEQSFTWKQSLLLHFDKHDIPRQIHHQTCLECQEKVKLEEIATHLREKHGVEEIIKCGHCSFQFRKREHLIDHLFEHRYSQLRCDICGENVVRHAALVEHYFKKHQIGRQWTCNQCGKIVWKERSLRIHVKLVHGEKIPDSQKNDVTFQCQECGQAMKSKYALRNHQIKFHGANPYVCNFCKKTFTILARLREHHNTVHKGVAPVEFRCLEPNCKAVFKLKKHLKHHHSVIHLGEKGKHICDQCGKSFWLSAGLRKHKEKTHLELRKFVCTVCKEAFKTEYVLKNHQLIHTEERSFACEICGQLFRQKVVLARHLDGHRKQGADFMPRGARKQIRKRCSQQSKVCARKSVV